MIRVAVVDDHPVVREGLVSILKDEPDFDVVGSAGSAEDLLTLVDRAKPDVVLIDLELPEMNGVQAIERLAQTAPQTRLIVFTAYDTEEKIADALRAGAKGYLLKGASADRIGRAIRDVHAGGSALEPRVASRLVARLRGASPSTTLTSREREVLRLISQGQSNRQIAKRLSITERTVKYHVGSILNKLGADNRAQAVALAAERHII